MSVKSNPRIPILDEVADQDFHDTAIGCGLDPGNRWIGGYVNVEWARLRHILQEHFPCLEGLRILEFGCNIGASAIVAAKLGGRVVGVDVDETLIRLARLNIKRYGVQRLADVEHIRPERPLPFGSESFDIVMANSVFEYVAPPYRKAAFHEIDRILKVGGTIIVTGTSNRLWPKEVHSGKWFSNYMSRSYANRTRGGSPQGIFPWEILRHFPNYINLDKADHGRSFISIRKMFGDSKFKIVLLRFASVCALLTGQSIGVFASNYSAVLRKKSRKAP